MIKSCPTGFPFAQKIRENAPISEAIKERVPDSGKIIYDMVRIKREDVRSVFSNPVK
jgi:hypothetical protein